MTYCDVDPTEEKNPKNVSKEGPIEPLVCCGNLSLFLRAIMVLTDNY